MATTFRARLPVGHALLKATISTVNDKIAQDARLKSAPPASVNDKREWCAALLYLADNSPFTDAAFGHLSPSERTVLFTMFGVGQAGGAAAATATLIAAINGGGPQDSVTFISLLPASDTSTATLTKVQATGILKQLPIKIPQPSTVGELREIVAATIWCENVMASAADIQALPARLRGILEDIFEMPRLDEAPRAASAVTLWATAHQQAAGAPSAQPQPVSAAQPQASAQPAAQPAAAVQPALGAQQQPAGQQLQPVQGQPAGQPLTHVQPGAGVVPGSWPPPPPPPPPLPWSTASTSTFTPTVWGNEATPHRIVFSSPQQLGAAVAGYGGGLAGGRYGSLSSAAWQGNPGASWGANLEQLEIQRAKAELNSLCLDVSAFLTLDEQKQLLNQQKLAGESSGSKQPVRIPYASVPWQQALEIPVNSELNPAIVARQLTIALTCDSQEYTSAVDQLMRQSRANEVEKIKRQFSTAYSAGDLAGVQLAGEQVRRHCTTEMEGILARAIALSARFPSESAFWEVTGGRTIQSQQLPTFLSTLASKIVGDGDTINDVQIAGCWKLFFDHWGHRREATNTMAKITQLGESFRQKMSIASDDADDSASKAKTRKPDRGAPSANKAASSPPKTSGGGMPVGIQATIPCSPSVIGVFLGAKAPQNACHFCSQPGHWKTDCPQKWGEQGMTLPGFSSRGKRLAGKWTDNNPNKEVFKEWVKFLENPDNFPKGAKTAPLDNAPDMQTIRKAARQGVPF